jgi:hypothetical protein
MGRKAAVVYADPPWLLKPPNTILTAGIFVLLLAAGYTYTGKAWIRYQRWVYRAKEPKRYWREVSKYYLLGFALIVLFLYEIHAVTK